MGKVIEWARLDGYQVNDDGIRETASVRSLSSDIAKFWALRATNARRRYRVIKTPCKWYAERRGSYKRTLAKRIKRNYGWISVFLLSGTR